MKNPLPALLMATCWLLRVILLFMALSKLAISFRGLPRRGLRLAAVRSPNQLAFVRQTATVSSLPAAGPKVDYFSPTIQQEGIGFGEYELIASQGQDSKVYTNMATLGAPDGPVMGSKVWIRGRVTALRAKGNACFIVVRDGPYHTVQACHFKDKAALEQSKALLKFAGGLTLESIVDIHGTVVSAEVKACSQGNVEIQMDKLFVVSAAPAMLPFLQEDGARSDAEIEASQSSDRPLVGVSSDIRLNNRWLDLRVPANNAIMRIRSAISLLFREALLKEDFIEINTPKLIAGESEGGSEVFRTDYFGKPACLAQSPQLYKQMAISADLGRVFEIGPVFRAEKSLTRRHLCEFTGLDLEMAIQSNYSETLLVLHGLFRHIFEGLESRFAKELAIVRAQYPSEAVRFTDQPLVIHWPEAIQMLRDAGQEVGDYDDLNTALELVLGGLVKAKYDADFYMIDQYPSDIRPFYTMPNITNSLYSNSYDLFLRGQEICSGAQRCHDADMLEKRIIEKDMDPHPLRSYIDSFRHGISPHAGAGIGLDRVVFLYLGLDNVRKASMFPRDPNRCTP